jgi:hypothetical protein
VYLCFCNIRQVIVFGIFLYMVQTCVNQNSPQPRFKGLVKIELVNVREDFHETVIEHLNSIRFVASIADTDAHTITVKVAIQIPLALPVIVLTAVNNQFQKLLNLCQFAAPFQLPYFSANGKAA